MGLFGGGALRRQIAALTEQLEQMKAEVAEARSAKAEAERLAAERDEAAKAARLDKKKADKKLDQVKDSRRSSDEKAVALQGKVEHLESELADFRRAMLDSKNAAELARARVAELEAQLEAARRVAAGPARPKPTDPAPAAPAEAAAETPPEEARPKRREDDPRIERLREQLAAEKDANKALRDKVAEAEKAARNADRKRISEIDKAEAVVRDLQHHLRAERRAYKILQLQYEAQIDRVRGAEQTVQARVEAELARAAEAPAQA